MRTAFVAFGIAATLSAAADIKLPEPVKTGGMPLMQALGERKSSRSFAARELPAETLAALLWAADGINRPDGRRTAPTGLNVQDTDVYVMTKSGAYRYDAKANALILVNAGDHRHAAGRQDFAKAAPVTLFYVQDAARAMKSDEASAWRYAGIHTGAVMQNVYLFCAKEGLATVARAYLDYAEVAKALKLAPSQRTILAQSVGYPAGAK